MCDDMETANPDINKKAEETLKELEDILLKLTSVDALFYREKLANIGTKAKKEKFENNDYIAAVVDNTNRPSIITGNRPIHQRFSTVQNAHLKLQETKNILTDITSKDRVILDFSSKPSLAFMGKNKSTKQDTSTATVYPNKSKSSVLQLPEPKKLGKCPESARNQCSPKLPLQYKREKDNQNTQRREQKHEGKFEDDVRVRKPQERKKRSKKREKNAKNRGYGLKNRKMPDIRLIPVDPLTFSPSSFIFSSSGDEFGISKIECTDRDKISIKKEQEKEKVETDDLIVPICGENVKRSSRKGENSPVARSVENIKENTNEKRESAAKSENNRSIELSKYGLPESVNVKEKHEDRAHEASCGNKNGINLPQAKLCREKTNKLTSFCYTGNKDIRNTQNSSEDRKFCSENVEKNSPRLTCCTSTAANATLEAERDIIENDTLFLSAHSDVKLQLDNEIKLSFPPLLLTQISTDRNNQIDARNSSSDTTHKANTSPILQSAENSVDMTDTIEVYTSHARKDSYYAIRKSDGNLDVNFNKTSKENSKRRESTSPDEGIAYSPAEMDDSPSSPRRKTLPELQERLEDYPHIKITIEGGSKSKKRSSRQSKGNRHKTSGELNHKTADVEKGNELVIKSVKNQFSGHDDSSRATKKKSSTRNGKLSDKTVAKNVVKSAMIENSLAKKNKPIWVEISKEKSGAKMSASKKTQGSKEYTNGHGSNPKSSQRLHRGRKEEEKTEKSRKPNQTDVYKSSGKYDKTEADYRQERYSIQGAKKKNRINKDSRDMKEYLRKIDVRREEAPRTLRHPARVVKPEYISAKDVKTNRAGKHDHKEKSKIRSVSADSSVRDLSYSSSSSDSESYSSNESYSSSATSGTHSASSSVSSTSHSTSSSALSSTYSSSSSTQTSLKKTDRAKDSHSKRKSARPVKPRHRSDEKPSEKTSILEQYEQAQKKMSSAYQGKSKRTGKSYETSRRVPNDEGRLIDQKPARRTAKEKTHDLDRNEGYEEDQEFEVNLERRRNRTRRRPIESDEKKDSQKNHWQHQRLVMTSQRPDTTNPRASEKTRTESHQASKQKSFEASAKDSSGAVLTIRDLYSLHHVLSDTQNGTVIAGHRRSDGMRVAIKRIAKSGTTRWGWMNGKVVPLELALICQVNEIRHAGVVEIVEWHETTEAFLLVMVRPHPSVDLYDHVTKHKRLKETVARRIIRQLILALLHCNKMGVLHRDVKLENILFNPVTVETILIDFGCGDYHRSGPYKEFAGTPEYYPPEWFLCKQYHGDSATVWSIGVLLYSLLCGTLPFRSSKDIINKELNKYPADVTRNAKHLIALTVQKNPRERIELKAILDHPWFKSSKDHSGYRNTSV